MPRLLTSALFAYLCSMLDFGRSRNRDSAPEFLREAFTLMKGLSLLLPSTDLVVFAVLAANHEGFKATTPCVNVPCLDAPCAITPPPFFPRHDFACMI